MKYLMITDNDNGQLSEDQISIVDIESEEELEDETMIFYWKLEDFKRILVNLDIDAQK